MPLIEQLREVHEKVGEMDRQIHAWHRKNELSRRLETVPGIGPNIVDDVTRECLGATPSV